MGRVLAWLVILAVAAILLLAVFVPRVAGATPYAVLTGSMRPDLPPGTLVVVKPKDFDQIAVGDVVTYQLESGRSEVVTHRVVGVNVGMDGERTLRTRGDANGALDADPVREVQVKGVLWYSVPVLGHAHTMLDGKERQMAVYVVAALLLGYAGFMFTSALRDRRRGSEDTGHDTNEQQAQDRDAPAEVAP